MQRHWDETLRLLLAAVGVTSGAAAAAGCVEAPSRRTGETDGKSAAPDARSPATRDARAADATLDAGPTSTRDSAAIDSTASREGESSRNEAGITTTRVPDKSPDCPLYPEAQHPTLKPEVLATSCSAEAAAEDEADYACFASPRDGGSCDRAYVHACIADEYERGGLVQRAAFVCGPVRATDAGCCYVLTGENYIGRPFFVEGAVRRATAEVGTGWAVRADPDVSRLDLETRRALADVYTREAMAEHASVASFARFALQCLSCGAPAELVRGAQQAALDEVAHTELALGLAAAYGGSELRPGRLDVRGALDGDLDVLQVAESVAREGAIAETVSALLVAAARDAAEDPCVRAILARVASEELEHALLAWKYLRWAVEQGGEPMHAALEPIFASAHTQVGFGSVTRLSGDERAMRAHGYLPITERRAVAEQALVQLVAPAAQALLSRAAPPQPRSARGHGVRPA